MWSHVNTYFFVVPLILFQIRTYTESFSNNYENCIILTVATIVIMPTTLFLNLNGGSFGRLLSYKDGNGHRPLVYPE